MPKKKRRVDPEQLVDSFGRLARESWDNSKLLAVSFVGFAVVLVISVAYTLVDPSDTGFRTVCVVVVAFVLNTVLLMVIPLRQPPPPTPPTPPTGPDGPGDVPPKLFDLSYFRSPYSRQIASEFSAHCASDHAEDRFFVEMLVHRLNMLGALRHSHGYTIVRHCAQVPEPGQDSTERIMGDDYAAIMEVGIETAPSQDGKPALDTLIFRDVKLWRHPWYWEQNKPLAVKADLRRLFLYEDDFFKAGDDGLLNTPRHIQLVGLFSGARIHDSYDWNWRPLNASDPRKGVELNRLYGREEPHFEFQSSAAFAGHTVVFIRLMPEPWTLLHRFYNDSLSPKPDRVRQYTSGFDEAFSRIRKQTAEELYGTLREDHKKVASCIEKAWQEATELVPKSKP